MEDFIGKTIPVAVAKYSPRPHVHNPRHWLQVTVYEKHRALLESVLGGELRMKIDVHQAPQGGRTLMFLHQGSENSFNVRDDLSEPALRVSISGSGHPWLEKEAEMAQTWLDAVVEKVGKHVGLLIELPAPERRVVPRVVKRRSKHDLGAPVPKTERLAPAPRPGQCSVLLAFPDGSSRVYEGLTMEKMFAVAETIRG